MYLWQNNTPNTTVEYIPHKWIVLFASIIHLRAPEEKQNSFPFQILAGPLVIQLVWYILKQLFTLSSVDESGGYLPPLRWIIVTYTSKSRSRTWVCRRCGWPYQLCGCTWARNFFQHIVPSFLHTRATSHGKLLKQKPIQNSSSSNG